MSSTHDDWLADYPDIACLNCRMDDFPRRLAHAHLDLELDRQEVEQRRAQFRFIEGKHDA